MQFQSTRSSQTSTPALHGHRYVRSISIHEVFADLDPYARGFFSKTLYFNPRGLRRPRPWRSGSDSLATDFNPRGLRRPRRSCCYGGGFSFVISIHEVFADLDLAAYTLVNTLVISIHEVFADLDSPKMFAMTLWRNFNPRGLRRPRPGLLQADVLPILISIHEVFADLDSVPRFLCKTHPSFQSTRSSQTST